MSISVRRRLFASLMPAPLLALAIASHALSPAKVKKPVEPTILKTSDGTVETGYLDDAPYRIDIPNNWNHSLVVFYHGYAEQPYLYRITDHINSQALPLFERGYAVIESGYSQTGWALEQAYPETEDLRRYFIKRYGQPRETYAAGGSMGGQLVAITLELNPRPYVGGLDLCGSVGASYQNFNRRFADRAAFDVYFPGVLPPLDPVPTGFEDTAADRSRVLAALRTNPAAATLLRNLTGLHSDVDLAHNMSYWTFITEDLQRRGGGNPFDNRNLIYSGTDPASSASDLDLNQRVHRYAADPRAQAYLVHHYTPTGNLGRPMLAIHTIYDPIVQLSQLPPYQRHVQAAGAGRNFVQQYVDREGHCNFTEDQIGDAFDELVHWTHGGPPPTPGLLKIKKPEEPAETNRK
ncbi:alpha/beta hydrolase [Granulicella sp. 5B5]|uniref:alpha/beta hydrolase n=1 Tax=Granulicella sp. 5B5 TaxID=1617967 RepID=UPI0015F5DC0F|nr:alpha/beta hydrolase [Granulicella sp. 5B5]QMV19371.1 alpha/beta hydrolase [Granulicella sp. 5B5]